jgi:hypothetical protein
LDYFAGSILISFLSYTDYDCDPNHSGPRDRCQRSEAEVETRGGRIVWIPGIISEMERKRRDGNLGIRVRTGLSSGREHGRLSMG